MAEVRRGQECDGRLYGCLQRHCNLHPSLLLPGSPDRSLLDQQVISREWTAVLRQERRAGELLRLSGVTFLSSALFQRASSPGVGPTTHSSRFFFHSCVMCRMHPSNCPGDVRDGEGAVAAAADQPSLQHGRVCRQESTGTSLSDPGVDYPADFGKSYGFVVELRVATSKEQIDAELLISSLLEILNRFDPNEFMNILLNCLVSIGDLNGRNCGVELNIAKNLQLIAQKDIMDRLYSHFNEHLDLVKDVEMITKVLALLTNYRTLL